MIIGFDNNHCYRYCCH